MTHKKRENSQDLSRRLARMTKTELTQDLAYFAREYEIEKEARVMLQTELELKKRQNETVERETELARISLEMQSSLAYIQDVVLNWYGDYRHVKHISEKTMVSFSRDSNYFLAPVGKEFYAVELGALAKYVTRLNAEQAHELLKKLNINFMSTLKRTVHSEQKLLGYLFLMLEKQARKDLDDGVESRKSKAKIQDGY